MKVEVYSLIVSKSYVYPIDSVSCYMPGFFYYQFYSVLLVKTTLTTTEFSRISYLFLVDVFCRVQCDKFTTKK